MRATFPRLLLHRAFDKVLDLLCVRLNRDPASFLSPGKRYQRALRPRAEDFPGIRLGIEVDLENCDGIVGRVLGKPVENCMLRLARRTPRGRHVHDR